MKWMTNGSNISDTSGNLKPNTIEYYTQKLSSNEYFFLFEFANVREGGRVPVQC